MFFQIVNGLSKFQMTKTLIVSTKNNFIVCCLVIKKGNTSNFQGNVWILLLYFSFFLLLWIRMISQKSNLQQSIQRSDGELAACVHPQHVGVWYPCFAKTENTQKNSHLRHFVESQAREKRSGKRCHELHRNTCVLKHVSVLKQIHESLSVNLLFIQNFLKFLKEMFQTIKYQIKSQ